MSTITQNITYDSNEFKLLRIGWSTYSTTGSNASITPTTFSTTVMKEIKDWKILKVTTLPGAASPTTAYDITITDHNSMDILGGAAEGRKATGEETVEPLIGSGIFNPPILSPPTFNLSGNSATGASGVCELLLGRAIQREL